jgi:DNA-binding NarL/FixJ family response regulator
VIEFMGSPDGNAIQVAIIEDQAEIRDGLAILINGTGGFRVAGKFGSIESALPRIASERPDVILVDIGLPGISGIDGIPLLREQCPDALFLVLTIHADDDRIFRALCGGASGYLLKNTPPARLLESLREGVDGGAPMSPEVARRVVQLFQRFRPPDPTAEHLTPHQLRLLKLLADGHNSKRAAEELGVTTNTVGFHTKRIYEKLHVHSKSEAVAKALRQGLIH